MARKMRKWSQDDKQMVIDCVMSDDDLAEYFGVTKTCIHVLRNRLLHPKEKKHYRDVKTNRRAKALYMAVGLDDYELPYAIADSPQELADICNVPVSSISSQISKYNKGELKRSRYIRVEIEEGEGECIPEG